MDVNASAVSEITAFVYTEYVVGTALAKRLLVGLDSISFRELNDYGRRLQKQFHDDGIDAVVINHSYANVTDSYPDFFEYFELNGAHYIKCKRGVTVERLQRYFTFPHIAIAKAMEAVSA